jgi:hypothetical protein
MKNFFLILICISLCPLYVRAQESIGLKQLEWNEQNFKIIKNWHNNITHQKAERLLVLTDCDNTAWAGDIADSVFSTAVKYKYITWANAPILPEYPFKKKVSSTPIDYYDYLYSINPVISYNYAAQAFAGLTLAKTYEIFKLAEAQKDFPIPYEEMQNLFGTLSQAGITVGFTSASPLFIVAPMVEKMGLDTPLWAIEGIDIYVKDPSNGSGEVLLSNLINSVGLKTWSDVIKYLGHLQITPHVSEIINARKGKSVSGVSIAHRYVTTWNRSHKNKTLAIDQMRLAGVFGDNFGPFSDLPEALPDESGNDQGMLRALPLLTDGTLIVNIYKGIDKNGFIDMEKYVGSFRRFVNLTEQMKKISHPTFVTQIATYKGDQIGFRRMKAPQFE